MPSLTRILVPVDFSPPARAALDYALLLAERFNAPVDILHVINMPPSYVGADVMVDVSGQSRQRLTDYAKYQADKEMKAFLDEVTPPKAITVSSRTEFGAPYDVIMRVADESKYDLIVMGTHGRTGFSHLLLGSVAEKLVRQAPCAVLTVRARASGG